MISPHGENFKRYVAEVPDFPVPGVNFKDLTPLFVDKRAFRYAVHEMANQVYEWTPDVIVGIDSRGYIAGAALANRLDCGFLPLKKRGKVAANNGAGLLTEDYKTEYSATSLEFLPSHIPPGSRVVIHDDVLAMGGTARAAYALMCRADVMVVGFSFIIALTFLKGHEWLNLGHEWHALMSYE